MFAQLLDNVGADTNTARQAPKTAQYATSRSEVGGDDGHKAMDSEHLTLRSEEENY